MLKITVCPVCGGRVEKVNQDWVGYFMGQPYVVHNLDYYVCQECNEQIFPHEAINKIQTCSPAYRQVKSTSETDLNFLRGAPDEEIDFSDIPEITKIQVTNARIRIGSQATQTPSENQHSPLE